MRRKFWDIISLGLLRSYESPIILLSVVLLVWTADFLFYHLIFDSFIKGHINNPQGLLKDGNWISFAPEAWLSLLGLVLGTLIIVISVASQSTPKLIDLYTGDKTSLWYIWYIIVGAVHNLLLQLTTLNSSEKPKVSPQELNNALSDALLNTYFMLPLALLLAVPYVLYILRYTKTSNVITKIYKNNIQRINRLSYMASKGLLSIQDENEQQDKKNYKKVKRYQRLHHKYQFEMFETLNQLDDLLEYVSFKEPKGDIMNKISLSIQTYISIKNVLKAHCPNFFHISEQIRQDVSFKTMIGQFDEMQKTRTFYEQKGFRLLGNAYIKLIEDEEFDLASLCAFELSECGRVAIENQDNDLINVVLIRFNTLIRFGIKHGLKNREARNLYNAIFHYSEFIRYIVGYKDTELIDRSCGYLNFYINEIYQHSRKEKPFSFLVDVFTWEFKRILVEMSIQGLDINIKKKILGYFLKIDNLSDSYEETSLKGKKFSNGIRGLQISLALYYLKNDEQALSESIIIDILSDHDVMSKEKLKEEITNTCTYLNKQAKNFFEDTDRGNMNIYYSDDKDAIPHFEKLFESMLQDFSIVSKNVRPPGSLQSPKT